MNPAKRNQIFSRTILGQKRSSLLIERGCVCAEAMLMSFLTRWKTTVIFGSHIEGKAARAQETSGDFSGDQRLSPTFATCAASRSMKDLLVRRMLYKCGVELTSPNPAAGLIENWCQAFITGSTRGPTWNQL